MKTLRLYFSLLLYYAGKKYSLDTPTTPCAKKQNYIFGKKKAVDLNRPPLNESKIFTGGLMRFNNRLGQSEHHENNVTLTGIASVNP